MRKFVCKNCESRIVATTGGFKKSECVLLDKQVERMRQACYRFSNKKIKNVDVKES